MYIRPRYRRPGYAVASERTVPSWVRSVLFLAAAVLVVYLLWTAVMRLLGVGNSLERTGVILSVEERGTVTVSIDGKDQRGEDGMMLFPGESVSTGPSAHASLSFFDGTYIRLDSATDVLIDESERGNEESIVTGTLETGSVWVTTPSSRTYSGSILRSIKTARLQFDLEPGTEALLTESSVTTYATEGAGIAITLSDGRTFSISEGQHWALPEGEVGENVYAYRTTISGAEDSAFILESRKLAKGTTAPTGSVSSGGLSDELLTLNSPTEGTTLNGPLLTIRGKAGVGVASVMVNGHATLLNPADGTFTQDLVPPDGTEDIEVTVQALASDGTILAETHRIVKRAAVAPLSAPTVTSPAKSGETFKTNAEELILRGQAPAGAVEIRVNDYKLQLFSPEKGEWSYVASIRLKNMIPGTNVFNVVATDAQGRKSDPGVITIIQGEGSTGVVTSAAGTASSGTAPVVTDPASLPNNDPISPGTLTVTAPAEGTSYTMETGSGFLLEGKTSKQTASVWVNDYKLQLYTAGKDFWNYRAEEALKTLKQGTNTYKIVARNDKNEILDVLTYTVEKK